MPAAASAVLLFQFRGSGHHPPVGDHTNCGYGNRAPPPCTAAAAPRQKTLRTPAQPGCRPPLLPWSFDPPGDEMSLQETKFRHELINNINCNLFFVVKNVTLNFRSHAARIFFLSLRRLSQPPPFSVPPVLFLPGA